ncbi:MAG TPA: DoxX family protein [Bryobacteraceae bacterium]
MKTKAVLYWTATVLIALELLVGGMMDLLRNKQAADVIAHLGYPSYLLTILGVWKLLGAAALLVPRFPRLKEWAYAGAIFDMTGAAFSSLAAGDSAATIAVPLVLTAIALVSWALRPPGRILGGLFRANGEPVPRS